MMDQALRFVLDTVFGLLTYAFLLRFMMQWLRAPFRNPAGQAVTAMTDWAVKPLRRLLPGFKGQDTSTLVLAWVAQFVWLVATSLVIRHVAPGGTTLLAIALVALIELFKGAVWVLIITVIIQAVLSWVGPDGPLAGFLNAMTFRFLAPIRRLIPPIGGTLDLSPLILIVLLQLVLMVPLPWLESAVFDLFVG
jgi:YggT family protein